MPTTLSNRLVRILQVVYRRVRYGYWEPIEANLEAFLKTTLLASHSIDIIQVGANDGVTHDLVYPFLQEKMLHRAVLVEPLPEAFSRLRSLHQGNPKITLENVAISATPGSVTMYTVDDENRVTTFDSKISSLDRAHLEKFIEYDPRIASVIREEKVQSDTIANVICRNEMLKLDLLCIDAEGYDYEILKMVPWESCDIRAVFYEQAHLGHEGRVASYRLLRSMGFRLYQHGRDVLGIRSG